MNDELEEGEVAMDSLETDIQDELKTHKEKKKVKKSKNKPTSNSIESPEDPYNANPNPYERIEKKIKVEGKPFPRKGKNEFTTSTYKSKPCEFYRKGSCQKGNDCSFSHDIAVGQPEVVCKFYVSGNCQKGDSCPFSHDLKKYPCKYFWGAGNCSQGDNCKFSHEPLLDKQKAMDFIEENEQHFMNMYNSMGDTNLGNYFVEYLQRKADQNKDPKAQHLLLPPTQDQSSSFMAPPLQQQNQFSIPNYPPANIQPRQYQNPNPYDRPPQNQQHPQMYPGPGSGPGPGRPHYIDPNLAQKQNFMPPQSNQNFQNPQFQPPNQYMPQSSQPPQHLQQNYQPQPNRQFPPQNQFGPGPQNQMNHGFPQNQNIHGPPQMNQPQPQMQMQHHPYQPKPQHQPQPQHHQYQQPHHYQPHPSQNQNQQHPQHHHYQPRPSPNQQHPQHQHHHFVPQQQGPMQSQGPPHNQYQGGGGDPRFQRQHFEENRIGQGGGPHNVYGPPSRMENNPYNNPNNPPHYQKPLQQDNFQPQGGPMMHPQNEPWRRQPQGPQGQGHPQQGMNQFPNQPQPQPQILPENKQYGGGGGMQQILPPAQNTAVFLGPPRDSPSVNTFTPGLNNQQQQQGILTALEEINSPTENVYLPTNKDPRSETQKKSEEKLPNQYFSKDAKPPAEIKPTREKGHETIAQEQKPTEEHANTGSETTNADQPAKTSFWKVVKSRQIATKSGRKGVKSPTKEDKKPVLMQYSPEHTAAPKIQEKPKEKIKDPNEEKYFNKSKILEKLGLTSKTNKKAEPYYDMDKLFSTFEFHSSEKGFPPAKIPKEVAISNLKDTINSLKELLTSNE